nr:L-type lectin-domain containing receptor kinase IX.1-like [Tanacetum cinerariifolium]
MSKGGYGSSIARWERVLKGEVVVARRKQQGDDVACFVAKKWTLDASSHLISSLPSILPNPLVRMYSPPPYHWYPISSSGFMAVSCSVAVLSFYGVVALELATGRRTIDPNVEDDKKVLVRWMQNLYKAGNVFEGVDPKLGDDYDELQMKGLMVIGLWCVLHDFHKRPSMKEVVHVLDNTHDPLSDLHGTLPCLAPDSVTHDFDLILGSPLRSSDLIIPMEMETPKSVDLVVQSSGSARLQDYTYSSLFVWRQIRVHPCNRNTLLKTP